MATEKAAAEYLQEQVEFTAELKESGREVSFGNRAVGDNPWNPSDEYVEAGTAFVFPSEWKRDFSSDVQANDLIYFVSAETDISQCRIMRDGDQDFSIVTIKPFKPNEVIIYYEIQVRK